MKTIYLLAQRLRQYAKKDKVIFSVFLIGGLINSVMFAYFYGNMLPSVVNRNSQGVYYRQYRADLTETYGASELGETIGQLQSNPLIESVKLSTKSSHTIMDFTQYMCTVLGNEPGVVIMKGTATFTAEGQIIVPVEDTTPIGGVVEIDGHSYTVIGQHTVDEYYVISNADYFQNYNVVDRIYVLSAQKHSYRNDPVEALMYDVLPTDYVRTPFIYVHTDELKSQQQLIVISVVYIISVISFISLLRYLIDSMIDENVTSMIVGAPKATVVAMIFREELFLFLIPNVIGLLLHYALTPALFSKINIVQDAVYTLSDYATILLIMLVLTVVCLLPLLRKYTKLSPVAARRQQI